MGHSETVNSISGTIILAKIWTFATRCVLRIIEVEGSVWRVCILPEITPIHWVERLFCDKRKRTWPICEQCLADLLPIVSGDRLCSEHNAKRTQLCCCGLRNC